jgi:diguanylate cyclase (GGDEF)-like protein
MHKALHFGLREKLVLMVVVGIVVSFSIIGTFRWYAEKTRIMGEIDRTGRERAILIAEAVANLLIGYDYTNMESLSDRIMKQPDMRKFTIRNSGGKIMVTREAPTGTDGSNLSFEAPIVFGTNRIGGVEMLVSLERAHRELAAIFRDIVIEQIYFGLTLGLLIYLAASRIIVKPVQRIGQHMKSILSGDKVTSPVRLDIPNHDELGDLVSIFNNLNQQVYEMQQRLQEKIDLTGTALMNTNEQLRLRSSELESRSNELEKALALVEKLADTDGLTGLHNRRYFDNALSSLFHLAQRYNESLCLVLVDVDHFKQINDKHGHSAGDQLLQALGNIFKSCVRETDTVARLGGDEFAFLLYHTGKNNALKMANNCLNSVAGHPFQYSGVPIRATLSIGIADCKDVANSIDALFNAADEALYAAKERGRNQVIAYPV